eukprot:CAMPEP_0113263554 /NCGR_PEP_ID=MMETSP0008_2-20120614/18511_1 /TAXON_ID=97485 /ORGANISM="Prymnesium parvum" /LENGTH=130 /DNA_ID=CAMNT_0000112275 /DNA_START=1 /DNA_END=394 /DNA_ORIENTATION=+ /assembly_acc=CAM_ASM_000153
MHPQIRMRLCMFLLLALGASCDKYTCVFDCFLFLESVSASGYVEYQCSGGAGNCCGWENCVAPANALYSSFTRDTLNGPWPSRGTLTPGLFALNQQQNHRVGPAARSTLLAFLAQEQVSSQGTIGRLMET